MIALASDHAGFELKEILKKHLIENNYDIMDYGTSSTASVDYPIYAKKAAKAVADGQCERGIVCCGTGIGVSITANKVKGIRCALIHDEYTAEMCKKHNNANMIAIGARVVDPELAVKLVDIWLNTQFEEGRHQRRIDEIEDDLD
ncbi:MAG: ribose 5-phosphate isomerase B [Anaerovoracaceae bacterium]|nr:ribose 5-phosphate isomerase B [Bacillota bacterium]MDY2670827.1 ribose 5-phosphate isomerase B [Anaerovoracaceae bacterium]